MTILRFRGQVKAFLVFTDLVVASIVDLDLCIVVFGKRFLKQADVATVRFFVFGARRERESPEREWERQRDGGHFCVQLPGFCLVGVGLHDDVFDVAKGGQAERAGSVDVFRRREKNRRG